MAYLSVRGPLARSYAWRVGVLGQVGSYALHAIPLLDVCVCVCVFACGCRDTQCCLCWSSVASRMCLLSFLPVVVLRRVLRVAGIEERVGVWFV